jgi:hypothetical protein
MEGLAARCAGCLGGGNSWQAFAAIKKARCLRAFS